MCEILAPAGDIKSAYAAINSGADAIYLGLVRFSARSSAENFDTDSFAAVARMAHAFGVKVYVAMNTLIKDEELDGFLTALIEAWNNGADAIILSDIFLGKFIKENYPQIKLYLSTQAGVCNVYGATLAKKYGFDRVILARETPVEEIKLITKIIETEVFVQGALCTCFSGQCYMSSFAGGNSGNRGRCKQPCRKLYSIDRDGYTEKAYRLSLSDLSVGGKISDLIEAGVSSFKIEGRMRRPEYVSAAVKYYKNLLKNSAADKDLSDLKRTYNRGNYTRGLAFGQDKTFISSSVQGHIGEFAGVLKVENGKYLCMSKEKFGKGDSFKILRGGKEVGGADFAENTARGFIISSRAVLRSGDKVFVTTDSALNAELLSVSRKIAVRLSIRLCFGELPTVTVNGQTFYGESVLPRANNRPITPEQVKDCFNKVDKYPYRIEYEKIETDGIFMAASELNALRRAVYNKYFDSISATKNPHIDKNHTIPQLEIAENNKIAVISAENAPSKADFTIYKPADYMDDAGVNKELYLYLPPFMTSAEIVAIKPQIARYGGLYCESGWAIELAEELDMPLFAGTGLNISNAIDVAYCPADYIVLSKELTFSEQKKLGVANAFALSAGNIKVMDLIYCPFGRRCGECDRRAKYTLTDENGRKFPVRRYQTSLCRFEVFNCVNLVGVSPVGTFLDCTLEDECNKTVSVCADEEKQRELYIKFTHGHGNSPVL